MRTRVAFHGYPGTWCLFIAGSSTFSVGKSSCLRDVRCLASIPFPLTPTLSPRRGSRALRTQVEATSMWKGLAIVLPLLGERVGVRGTRAHDYPWLTHWNHRGTVF